MFMSSEKTKVFREVKKNAVCFLGDDIHAMRTFLYRYESSFLETKGLLAYNPEEEKGVVVEMNCRFAPLSETKNLPQLGSFRKVSTALYLLPKLIRSAQKRTLLTVL